MSIRVPDELADRLDAASIDKAAALEAALNPKLQNTVQQQQIDRITIRIDMR